MNRSSATRLEAAFGLVLAVLAAATALSSLELGLESGGIPGAGFFPFWLGCLLFLAAALLTHSSITRSEAESLEVGFKGPLVAVAAAAGYALASWLLGMVIASWLYLFLVFRFHSGFGIVTALVGSMASALVLYFLFVLWLTVPLPRGVLTLL